jgi:polyhydroxyalkanoate synthesis regulator phasin
VAKKDKKQKKQKQQEEEARLTADAGGAEGAAAGATDDSGAPIDKSVQAFRESLERSVTVSRDRLQEVVDDAVRRGRMTRDDANDLISRLIARGREQADELVRQLESLLRQARSEVETRTAGIREQATSVAERAAGAARDVADRPLAEVDKLRRERGIGSEFPITAYDQLTEEQVRMRIDDLNPEQLQKVLDYEKANENRKGLVKLIKKRL